MTVSEMTKNKESENTLVLSFEEFLSLVKVVKMLYGREVAERLFTKKIKEWYNIDSVSVFK